MSKDYFQVIDSINDCYKKMLEIGKCKEVFRPVVGHLESYRTHVLSYSTYVLLYRTMILMARPTKVRR